MFSVCMPKFITCYSPVRYDLLIPLKLLIPSLRSLQEHMTWVLVVTLKPVHEIFLTKTKSEKP